MRPGNIRIALGLALMLLCGGMFSFGPGDNDGYGIFAIMGLAPFILAVGVAGAMLVVNGFDARSKPQPRDPWAFDPALDGADAEDLRPRP